MTRAAQSRATKCQFSFCNRLPRIDSEDCCDPITSVLLGFLSITSALLTSCTSKSAIVSSDPAYIESQEGIEHPDSAGALANWITVGELDSRGRPEGAYTLSTVSTHPVDREACVAVLQALGKPTKLTPEALAEAGLYGYSYLILGNEYSVEWTYFDSDATLSRTPKVNLPSRTVVDIDNDGDLDTIYRHNLTTKDHRAYRLVGYEGTPPVPEKRLSLSRIAKLESLAIDNPSVDAGGLYPEKQYLEQSGIPKEQRIDLGYAHYSLQFGEFIDVLRIKDNTYILAGGSLTENNPWYPVPVRLFRPSAYRAHSYLCAFEPNYP